MPDTTRAIGSIAQHEAGSNLATDLDVAFRTLVQAKRETDAKLVELVGKGWAAWEKLSQGAAVNDATRRSHLTRLARLRFLAPDIVTAILDGRQPVALTSRSLLRISDLPLGWDEQRRVLGFA